MGKMYSFETKEELKTPQQVTIEGLINQQVVDVSGDIQTLLQTPHGELVTLNEHQFETLLRDYIIQKMNSSGISFSLPTTMGFNYVVQFCISLLHLEHNTNLMAVLENPYYTYWYNQGNYKNAGDSGTYNYLFAKNKNMMTSQENLKFAFSGYTLYFGDATLAQGVTVILPLMFGFQENHDFFRRKLNVVNARNG